MQTAKANRELCLNIAGTVAIKGLALLVQLALMPAYMRYFKEQTILGVWFTIVSMLSWILTFDLGIGHGLRNKLAVALTRNDATSAKKYVSSAYVMLGAASFVVGIICVAFVRFVDWNLIFNIAKDVIPQIILTETITIVLMGIIANFTLHLISSVLYAHQVSAVVNLLALLQNLLLLAYLYMATPGNALQNLRSLAWVNAICMNLPSLVATIVIFSTKLRNIRPSLRGFSKEHARATLSLGAAFLFLQIIGIVVTQNEFFIAQFFSPEAVVDFQIYNRLFGLVVSAFSLLLTPLWSAVTKAIAQGRFSWVKKLFKGICLLLAATTLLPFAMIPCLGWLFRIWLGANAPMVNMSYAIAMACVGVMQISYFAWSTLSYGMNLMKVNIIVMSIAAAVKIPLIYLLSFAFADWVAVAWAHVIALLPYAIIMPIAIWRHLRRIEAPSSSPKDNAEEEHALPL